MSFRSVEPVHHSRQMFGRQCFWLCEELSYDRPVLFRVLKDDVCDNPVLNFGPLRKRHTNKPPFLGVPWQHATPAMRTPWTFVCTRCTVGLAFHLFLCAKSFQLRRFLLAVLGILGRFATPPGGFPRPHAERPLCLVNAADLCCCAVQGLKNKEWRHLEALVTGPNKGLEVLRDSFLPVTHTKFEETRKRMLTCDPFLHRKHFTTTHDRHPMSFQLCGRSFMLITRDNHPLSSHFYPYSFMVFHTSWVRTESVQNLSRALLLYSCHFGFDTLAKTAPATCASCWSSDRNSYIGNSGATKQGTCGLHVGNQDSFLSKLFAILCALIFSL